MKWKDWLPIVAYSLMILYYLPKVAVGVLKDGEESIGASGLALLIAVIMLALLIQKHRSPSTAVTSSSGFKWFRIVSAYLFGQELIVICAIGLILNFVGLAVSIRVWSILYLDMTGTAVVAFLLGPWWGAVVGTLSNAVLNWLLFPQQPYAAFLPWTLVNIAGGLVWGFLGRTERFRDNIEAHESYNVPSLFNYLLVFGVLPSIIMGFVGTCVQAVLGVNSQISFDPKLSNGVERLVSNLQGYLLPILQDTMGARYAQGLSWAIPTSLLNCIRFVPDKMISVAVALAVIRYGLPLFKRQLALGGSTGKLPSDNWTGPAALALAYSPCFVYFMLVYYRYWLFWMWPLVLAVLGIAYLLFRAPSNAELAEARNSRLEEYLRVYRASGRDGTVHFRDRYGLWFGTTAASGFFLLSLPLLGVTVLDFYRITLNFLVVIFVFFLAVQLLLVVAAQTYSSSRDDG